MIFRTVVTRLLFFPPFLSSSSSSSSSSSRDPMTYSLPSTRKKKKKKKKTPIMQNCSTCFKKSTALPLFFFSRWLFIVSLSFQSFSFPKKKEKEEEKKKRRKISRFRSQLLKKNLAREIDDAIDYQRRITIDRSHTHSSRFIITTLIKTHITFSFQKKKRSFHFISFHFILYQLQALFSLSPSFPLFTFHSLSATSSLPSLSSLLLSLTSPKKTKQSEKKNVRRGGYLN